MMKLKREEQGRNANNNAGNGAADANARSDEEESEWVNESRDEATPSRLAENAATRGKPETTTNMDPNSEKSMNQLMEFIDSFKSMMIQNRSSPIISGYFRDRVTQLLSEFDLPGREPENGQGECAESAEELRELRKQLKAKRFSSLFLSSKAKIGEIDVLKTRVKYKALASDAIARRARELNDEIKRREREMNSEIVRRQNDLNDEILGQTRQLNDEIRRRQREINDKVRLKMREVDREIKKLEKFIHMEELALKKINDGLNQHSD